MDATKVIDELVDAGFQSLESDDPVAFMEWRRRVAVALGPDHVYTQFFQDYVDKKSKNSAEVFDYGLQYFRTSRLMTVVSFLLLIMIL